MQTQRLSSIPMSFTTAQGRHQQDRDVRNEHGKDGRAPQRLLEAEVQPGVSIGRHGLDSQTEEGVRDRHKQCVAHRLGKMDAIGGEQGHEVIGKSISWGRT